MSSDDRREAIRQALEDAIVELAKSDEHLAAAYVDMALYVLQSPARAEQGSAQPVWR